MDKRETLRAQAELMYRFVMLYGDYMKLPQNYGTGEKVSMLEAHTLTLIAHCPGITAKEIAAHFQKTKGAISQIISRLECSGLIRRQTERGNEKNRHCYVTADGQALSDAHEQFDREGLAREQKLLSSYFAENELAAFYEILRFYTENILVPDMEKIGTV